MIMYCFCGSFCTLEKSIAVFEQLCKKGVDLLPVMSERTYSTDTRFGKAADFIERIENACGKKVIHTVKDAEPIGPKLKCEAGIISPCTGNTLAKIAHGMTDSAVTMAAKAHLRNEKPLVISLATNDALSANLENIGRMLRSKNVFFVPAYQDDAIKKPSSLNSEFGLIEKTLECAMKGKQIQPIFLPAKVHFD